MKKSITLLGSSASACELPDSYEPLSNDLAALLDQLGLDRVHVVGHSFGGQVAGRIDHLDHLDHLDPATFARSLRMISTFDVMDSLGSITAATTMIAAEHDPVGTLDHMRDVASRAPGGRFVEIAGAGHLLPLEAPGVLASALA